MIKILYNLFNEYKWNVTLSQAIMYEKTNMNSSNVVCVWVGNLLLLVLPLTPGGKKS